MRSSLAICLLYAVYWPCILSAAPPDTPAPLRPLVQIPITQAGPKRPIGKVVFSDDGMVLAAGTLAHTSIYPLAYRAMHLADTGDVATRQIVAPDEQREYFDFALSPDGATFGVLQQRNEERSSSTTVEVQMYDATRGTKTQLIRPKGSASLAISLSADSDTLSVGTELWDVQTAQRIGALNKTWEYFVDAIGCSSFSRRHFVACGYPDVAKFGAQVDQVTLWDVNSRRELRRFRFGCYAIAFSHDGQSVAAYGFDEHYRTGIAVWSVATGRKLNWIDGGVDRRSVPIGGLAFTPDDRGVLWIGQGALNVSELKTGRTLCSIKADENGAEFWSVAADPACGRIATGMSDQCVRLWELALPKSSGARESKRTAPAPRRDAHGDPLPADASARLGTMRLRAPAHAGWYWGVPLAFSDDGVALATASREAISIWEMPSQKRMHRFRVRVPSGVDFISGTNWAVAGDENMFFVLDLKSGEEQLRCTAHDNVMTAVHCFDDGKTLATGAEGGEVRRWDLRTGRLLDSTKPLDGDVVTLAHSSKGDLLASASNNKIVIERIAEGGRTTTRELSVRNTVGLSFSIDDTKLVSRDKRGAIVTCDIAAGDLAAPVYLTQSDRQHRELSSLGLSRDHKVAATLTGSSIDLWEIEKQEIRRSLPVEMPSRSTKAIAFDPTGKLLAAAGTEPVVHVWRRSDGRPVELPEGHTAAVIALQFSPDGSRLASSGLDGAVCLWDARTSRQIRLIHAGEAAVDFVAFSESGDSLVAADRDAMVRTWDVETGDRTSQFSIAQHGTILSYVFLPEQRVLLAGSREGSIVRCNITSGETTTTQLPVTELRALSLTEDGENAATISYPGRVAIWRISDGKRIGGFDYGGGTLDAVSFVAASTRTIVTASGLGSQIRFWRAGDGTELGDVPSGRSPFQGYAFRRTFAFSPDGKLMATEYNAGTTVIWQVGTGKEHQRLTRHDGDVRCLAFSPDGKRVATGSADTTVLIWPVQPRRLK